MTRRLVIAVLAQVLAVLVVPASTAAAGQAAPASDAPPAICAEGELLPHSPQLRFESRYTIFEAEVPGWIKACKDANPDDVSRAALTFARYYAGEKTALPWYVEAFPAQFNRVELSKRLHVQVTIIGPVVLGPPAAVCMVTGPQTRVACFEILNTGGGIPQVKPIPIDHPAVQKPVAPGGPVRPPNDLCGTCI